MIKRIRCAICDTELHLRWSDTHGVGACITCGLPYRVYHYEDDVRVDKLPSIAIKDEWVAVGRKYWNETHCRTFPAAFDFMNGRGGRTYSGATEDEIKKFNDWLYAHRAELPPPAVDEPQAEDAVAGDVK